MNSYKWPLIALLFAFTLTLGVIYWIITSESSDISLINPGSSGITPTPTPKPFLKYTFDNLKNTPGTHSQIQIQEVLNDEDEDYIAYLFSYQTQQKTMTGQLNIPQTATPSAGFPVVLMLRGFVDPSIYQTGIGTRNAAKFFSQNGFATIAPDFLGYGGSDDPHANAIAARIEKPLHMLDLLASLQTLNLVNPSQTFIWAHSNGGQIALSILEITGKEIPTTLWAPVSKPFPYSILYYTDEFDDQGKALRKVVADFETDYDVFDYSIDKYYPWIKAPIHIHQGTADDAIPIEWSQNLHQSLDDLDIETDLFIHPGADHNMRPAWSEAITTDLKFFNQYLQSSP